MFTVINQDEEALETATCTRDKLATLISIAERTMEAKNNPEQAAETNKAKRKQGKELFQAKLIEITKDLTVEGFKSNVAQIIEGKASFQPVERVLQDMPIWVGVAAVHAATYVRVSIGENSPYFVEGIIQGLRQHLFEQGVKPPYNVKLWKDIIKSGEFSRIIVAPIFTSSEHDRIIKVLTCDKLCPFYDDLGRDYETDYVPMTATTENGVAFLHGFKSAEDAQSLRWTSARAAAVVKNITGSEAQAKRVADTLRNVEYHTYEIYPNDCDFGRIYSGFSSGIDSCMSGNESVSMGNKGHLHPCTVYSSALHGKGDNCLALIVAFNDSVSVGRGILNTRTNQMVRWYGAHKAMVQLENVLGVEESNEALENSWLALIQDGTKFLHPYVDGNYCEGELDLKSKRVFLYSSSGSYIDLQVTKGFSYLESEHCCVFNFAKYPESAMTYQPESDTWIADKNIKYAQQCSITGEYFHPYNMSLALVRGEECMVWNEVCFSEWTDLGYDLGWVSNDELDDYRYDEVHHTWCTLAEYNKMIELREDNKAGVTDAA